MKKYEKYKDSGIDWIGEIPEGWEVKSVKRNFSFKTGFTPPTGKREYYEDGKHIWINISDLKDKYISDSENKITDKAIEDYKPEIVPKGSLLYSFKLSVGKVAFNTLDAYTNEAIFAIESNNKTNLNFFYFSLPEQIIQNANENIYGAKILNQELIKNAKLIIPPPEEQTAIANYLDRKTAQIDELIADKKRLLELYEEEKTAIINQAVTKGINPDVKMKDSGIEWLGEIPEHWEVKRIRHVAQIFGRIGYRGYKTTDLVPKGEGAITISPSNMKAYHMEFKNCTYLSWEKYEESPEIMIQNNDILFVKTGSTYGKVSFVENLPEKATINPQIIVLKQVSCNNKYLWYVLKSSNIIYQVERTVVGGTIPTISQAKINNYEFPIPTDKEQMEIVTFIDIEINRVDKTINKTKKLIDLLTEYRTALISEVVTGKIKVTE